MAELLIIVAGAVLAWAFAPGNWYWLAPLCTAVLFYHVVGVSPGRAAWRGLLFGTALFGAGFYWVTSSFYRYGNLGAGTALFVNIALDIILAGCIALACAIGSVSARRAPGLALLIVLPAGWVFSEWVRTWLFTGFPWLALGYSQLDGPLAGFAPIIGVPGISWLLALMAGAVVWVLRARSGASVAALLAVALLVSSIFLVRDRQWVTPAGVPLKVSLLQGNIAQDVKWRPEQLLDTQERYMEMIEAHLDSDLLVLPETALPENYSELRGFLEGIEQVALQSETDILIGLPIDDVDAGLIYNGVINIGATPGWYTKRHLVPIGEYLPSNLLFRWLSSFLDIKRGDFAPGDPGQPPLIVGGQPVALSICYEDSYPEEAFSSLPAATLLVNVSNDGWFGDTIAAYQHLQVARMRALEAGRPMLRAANTGISAVVDERGGIVAESKLFQQQVLTVDVQPFTGLTPYVAWGRRPLLAILLLAVLAGWLLWPGRKAVRPA